MHFGAVVLQSDAVLFNAIRKNIMLICPVAGNVNFCCLAKMVSARFLKLTVNKRVVVVRKYLWGGTLRLKYPVFISLSCFSIH